MLPARFLPSASEEFLADVAYYESLQAGLGERFRLSVKVAVEIAQRFPMLGSPWLQGTRRVFSKGFPYSIAYKAESTEIVIYAVAHFRRKPSYWGKRRDQ
jgi:plasmid stabilization system protein ParE